MNLFQLNFHFESNSKKCSRPIQMFEPSIKHMIAHKDICVCYFIFNQMLLNYLCVIRKVRMELLLCCTCVYECVCVRDAQCTLCILMRLILVLIFQCVDCGQPAELFVQSMLFRLFISVASWNCQKQVQTHVFLSDAKYTGIMYLVGIYLYTIPAIYRLKIRKWNVPIENQSVFHSFICNGCVPFDVVYCRYIPFRRYIPGTCIWWIMVSQHW